MRRGEIYLVDLDPASGSEADKRRPAVIVSNDGANTAAARRGRGVVSVVPLTSNVTSIRAFQAMLPADETGLDRDSKAQAEQVRSLDVSRCSGPIGSVPTVRMQDIDDALRLHLAL